MRAVMAKYRERVLAVSDDQKRQQPSDRIGKYMDGAEGAENDSPVEDGIPQPRQRRAPGKIRAGFPCRAMIWRDFAYRISVSL